MKPLSLEHVKITPVNLSGTGQMNDVAENKLFTTEINRKHGGKRRMEMNVDVNA